MLLVLFSALSRESFGLVSGVEEIGSDNFLSLGGVKTPEEVGRSRSAFRGFKDLVRLGDCLVVLGGVSLLALNVRDSMLSCTDVALLAEVVEGLVSGLSQRVELELGRDGCWCVVLATC